MDKLGKSADVLLNIWKLYEHVSAATKPSNSVMVTAIQAKTSLLTGKVAVKKLPLQEVLSLAEKATMLCSWIAEIYRDVVGIL